MPSVDDSNSNGSTSTALQRQYQYQRQQLGPQRPPTLSLVTHSNRSNSSQQRYELIQRQQQHASSSSALLSLSQDIAALVSLSFEATASLVNDYAHSALSTIGLGQRVTTVSRGGSGGGAGLAVVVVGAADPAGQSLTLRLAKSGYTVFPFVPITSASSSSPDAVPISHPLSTLLLAWSSVEKRLKARDPGHTGGVVPVVIDDSGDAYLSNSYTNAPPSPPKRSGRFSHAGDTVRHYCRENKLTLVAIVCAAPTNVKPKPQPTSKRSTPEGSPQRVSTIPGVDTTSLAHSEEDYLMALYRAQVLDPISVIRSLGDLLASPGASGGIRGRVLFVESSGSVDDPEGVSERNGATRMVSAARAEATRLLRAELGGAGIDVCEIVVGPMAPRLIGQHIRSGSGDSDTDRALAASTLSETKPTTNRDDALASRLRLIARVFAVDDALVYSCVRRAIEDRYPRARHHAGLAPLISSVVNATPGSGVVRYLGRWVLGRLFRSKQ